jgi:hypothetical protein
VRVAAVCVRARGGGMYVCVRYGGVACVRDGAWCERRLGGAGLFDTSHAPPTAEVREKDNWSRLARAMTCYTFDESLNGALTAPSVLHASGWAWVAEEVSPFSGERKVRGKHNTPSCVRVCVADGHHISCGRPVVVHALLAGCGGSGGGVMWGGVGG